MQPAQSVPLAGGGGALQLAGLAAQLVERLLHREGEVDSVLPADPAAPSVAPRP